MSSKQEAADLQDGRLLGDLIRKELLSIPLAQWGYFFPCQVAAWRFIEICRSGHLGPLDAGYDSEPYFFGKGADWFCRELGNSEPYLDLLEAIMYPLVESLPIAAKVRGYLNDASEIPEIDGTTIEQLAKFILAKVDALS